MRREIRCCHKYLPMAIIVAIMIPPSWMCATRKGMKRGLGGVYMQCCTLQCIHVPMPSWSYAQLCNWALIKFQLLKVKMLFTSITDICFSRIKRQCRSPVMSSTSKMVFFCLFSSPLVRCQCHLFVCWSDRHDICPNLYCRIFRPKNPETVIHSAL